MKTAEQKFKHRFYMREWRKRNPEKTKEIRRRFRVKNPERCGEYNRAYISKYKLEERARRVIEYLIYKKKITRPLVCEINTSRCGGQIEAHHEDYTKPRDVRWLCTKHHAAWHRIFIPERGEVEK